MAFAEDFGDFFDTDDFAIAVTYGAGTINVIFDAPHEYAGEDNASTTNPSCRCATSSLDASPVGDTIIVPSIAELPHIAAGTYEIVEHLPDGTGESELYLELQ